MSETYRDIVIKTYKAKNEQSSKAVRANPWPGQGLPSDANVECSFSMRKSHPVGTNFKVRAKITNQEGGTPFIYTSYHWAYDVLSDDEAKEFIKRSYGT